MNKKTKKYLFFILIIFSAFIFTACNFNNSENPVADYITYDDLPDDYSLETAKADNCVVYEDSNITAGQLIWDEFLSQTEKNKSSFVRLAFYYTIGDPESYDPEYYEEIKDDYPVLYIQDLKFDGKKYILTWTESDPETGEEKKYSFTYKYLKKFMEDPPNDTSTFVQYTYYALLNDDTVTAEQIRKGMFSSKFGDLIDHKKVYSKYEYK